MLTNPNANFRLVKQAADAFFVNRDTSQNKEVERFKLNPETKIIKLIESPLKSGSYYYEVILDSHIIARNKIVIIK